MNRHLLLAVLLVGAYGAVPAFAADDETPSAPTGSTAAQEAPDPPMPPVQASMGLGSMGLDQGSIFRILCGGPPTTDTALSTHLWQMAGTLADSSWTPPRVTVRVVVSDPAIR